MLDTRDFYYAIYKPQAFSMLALLDKKKEWEDLKNYGDDEWFEMFGERIDYSAQIIDVVEEFLKMIEDKSGMEREKTSMVDGIEEFIRLVFECDHNCWFGGENELSTELANVISNQMLMSTL